MSYTQQPYQPGYAPNQAADNDADSVGSWFLTIFLLAIPVVGFIYLIVLAVGEGRSIAKRNFARASLIWYLIGTVLAVGVAITMIALGPVILEPMLDQLEDLSNKYN